MSFQFYTNLHDNAPVVNGFDQFWKMVRDLMSDGITCYTSDSVNGHEITINSGANPCEKTVYLATNGVDTINNIKLSRKDLNTIISDKDLSELGQKITIKTDSSSFKWLVSYDEHEKKTVISNQFGSLVAVDGRHYVEKNGTSTPVSAAAYMSSSRYKIIFNETFMLICRDYSDNNGAYYFIHSDNKKICMNSSSGATILNIITSDIYIIDEKNRNLNHKIRTVGNIDAAFKEGQEINVLLSEMNTDYYVIDSIMTTITPFEIKNLHFETMFFEDENNYYVCVPNNFPSNFRYLVLRFKK